MTIAIALKVGDGIVLGADSAASIGGGNNIANVYFNAEKIFNLVKGLPIGVAVAGLGGLAGRSVTSLARDLRARIHAAEQTGGEWQLDRHGYTLQQAATLLRKFVFEEHYCQEYQQAPEGQRPSMSLLVAGYSAGQPQSEIWAIEIDQLGACGEPMLVVPRDQPMNAVWRGQPEALNRLFNGWSTGIYQRLMAAGIAEEQTAQLLTTAPNVQLLHPAMPLQDAIDLVHYMVDVTIGFVRFAPGAPTVAPPIDSAAITKHEHFRWVRRKHYFSAELNRPINRHLE